MRTDGRTDGRTEGRAGGRAVYGHVITKFSGTGRFTYPWCSAGGLRPPELRYNDETQGLQYLLHAPLPKFRARTESLALNLRKPLCAVRLTIVLYWRASTCVATEDVSKSSRLRSLRPMRSSQGGSPVVQ